MDPQKLSQLDPKLREAYQRVMGTVILDPPTAPPAQTQTPLSPIPDPTPTPVPQPAPEQTPTPQPQPQPEPAINPQQTAVNPQPEPTLTSEPSVPPQALPKASNFVQMNSEVPAAPTPAPAPNFTTPASQAQTAAIKKKGGMMMPVLFGIVGVIFVVIYTLFWTKIFNFKLPFLP